MEQVIVQVKGLHCLSCVARLERAFRKVEGVHRSKVDFRGETIDLAYEPEALDQRAVSSVIEGAGFEVVTWAPR